MSPERARKAYEFEISAARRAAETGNSVLTHHQIGASGALVTYLGAVPFGEWEVTRDEIWNLLHERRCCAQPTDAPGASGG